MAVLPPDLVQKVLSRKLRRNTNVANGHFVFPSIPGSHKPKTVRCHFRQNKLSLPQFCGQDREKEFVRTFNGSFKLVSGKKEVSESDVSIFHRQLNIFSALTGDGGVPGSKSFFL